jgi:hypothetical protein
MSLITIYYIFSRNVVHLSLKVKSLKFLIRQNLQISMMQWFQPTFDIFEMNDELAISYFIQLENLDRISRTNGPALSLTVINNTPLTSSVGVDPAKKNKTKMWRHYWD